jgi:putative endonuclease
VERGQFGESLAVDHLKRNGFAVLGRNWRFGSGEIDIIALEKSSGALVFVEVKLRNANALTSGYFAVNRKKKEILRKTCRAYLRKFAASAILYRFDIIEIRMDGNSGTHEISHYENVKLF